MTVKTTLSGLTTPDSRLPVAIDRDPAMTGGSIAKIRFKSPASFPAQTVGMATGQVFDLVSGKSLTIVQNNATYVYTAATGGVTISSEAGNQGMYFVPGIDLGAVPTHEVLIIGWLKHNLPVDGFARQLLRIGANTMNNATLRGTAANQIALEQTQGTRIDMWVAGQFVQGIANVPAGNVLTQIAFHIVPNSGGGLTTINVYLNGVRIGSVAVPYVPFAALDAASRRFSLGNDGGTDRLRYGGTLYEWDVIDVTAAGRNPADLVAADYRRNTDAAYAFGGLIAA